jgi:hypothetical protein
MAAAQASTGYNYSGLFGIDSLNPANSKVKDEYTCAEAVVHALETSTVGSHFSDLIGLYSYNGRSISPNEIAKSGRFQQINQP